MSWAEKMRIPLWIVGLGLILAFVPIAAVGGLLDFHLQKPHALVGACLLVLALAAIAWPVNSSTEAKWTSLEEKHLRHGEASRPVVRLDRISAVGPPTPSLLQVFRE